MRSSVVAARRAVSLLVASKARTMASTAAHWVTAMMWAARASSAARMTASVRWVSGLAAHAARLSIPMLWRWATSMKVRAGLR